MMAWKGAESRYGASYGEPGSAEGGAAELVAEDVRQMTWWIALYSGIVGAFLVFLLGVLREELRNHRERIGILRLLLAEIDYNAGVLLSLERDWQGVFFGKSVFRFVPTMKTDVWRDTRGKAAQLLSKELTEMLSNYYSALDNILTNKGVAEDKTSTVWVKAMEQVNTGEEAQHSLKFYIDYAAGILREQEALQDQISAYLDLSWGQRTILLIKARLAEVVEFGGRSKNNRAGTT